ncbi:hypothetical protein VUR80DRAFT_8333 [Thermomyces stellatus]
MPQKTKLHTRLVYAMSGPPHSSPNSKPLNPSSTIHALPSPPQSASHALPTTSSPGGRLPSCSIASTTCPSVVRMTLWSGQLALSTTAHGVSAGHSALFPSSLSRGPVSSATRPEMRCRAMRKTTVREATNSGGAGATPFLPVPVHTSTWSATSLWVQGTPAKSGALSALVTPGSTATRAPSPRSLKKATSSPPRP